MRYIALTEAKAVQLATAYMIVRGERWLAVISC